MPTIKKTLNQADLDFIIEGMKPHFATKNALGEVKDDLSEVKDDLGEVKDELNSLKESISHLPTKDEFFAKMDQVLAAVNKKDEEDLVHKGLHSNHTEDVANLQIKVNHLYKIFEVEPPLDPAY